MCTLSANKCNSANAPNHVINEKKYHQFNTPCDYVPTIMWQSTTNKLFKLLHDDDAAVALSLTVNVERTVFNVRVLNSGHGDGKQGKSH